MSEVVGVLTDECKQSMLPYLEITMAGTVMTALSNQIISLHTYSACPLEGEVGRALFLWQLGTQAQRHHIS